jgi:hypothetical protein
MLRYEGWAHGVSSAAPELRRAVAICPMDALSRKKLVGLTEIWITPLTDLEAEPLQPGSLLERREHGELVWADLGPYLDRLDGPPAATRAAVWAAWHLGYDGFAADGLTRWSELRGLGSGVDGSFTADSLLRSAPGVMMWPGRGGRVDPSVRLQQLALGLGDIRLLRRLNVSVGEASAMVVSEPLTVEERYWLDPALSRGSTALEQAHQLGALPPRVVTVQELESMRSQVLDALEELDAVLHDLLLRSVGLTQLEDGRWTLDENSTATDIE